MPLLLPLLEYKQEQLYRKLGAIEKNNIFIGAWPIEKHLRGYLRDMRRLINRGQMPRNEKKYAKSAQPTYNEIKEEYMGIQEAIMELQGG